jgi:hypothetical protein
MVRLLVALFLVVGFTPNLAWAVDILNPRACYGPFGASRKEAKCLPGDILFMTYEIDNLVKDKSGKVSYDTILQLLDLSQKDDKTGKPKVIYENTTANDLVPLLGGTRLPGDLHVVMGPKQAAGKYVVQLTVNDKFDGGKGVKFSYTFDVVEKTFGFVRVAAPTVGLPGTHYVTNFWLANLGMNAKNEPNAELTIKILDEKGTAVSTPVKMLLPRDMPEGVDLKTANFIPLSYPVYLNRPGRYTIEMVATDNIAKKTETLSYPLTVVDVNKIVSGK